MYFLMSICSLSSFCKGAITPFLLNSESCTQCFVCWLKNEGPQQIFQKNKCHFCQIGTNRTQKLFTVKSVNYASICLFRIDRSCTHFNLFLTLPIHKTYFISVCWTIFPMWYGYCESYKQENTLVKLSL